MKDTINEIVGSISKYSYNNPQNNNPNFGPITTGNTGISRSNIKDVGLAGVKISHCHQMRPYQMVGYNLLQKHRNLYYVALPSAGKSLYYICYWADNMLHLNSTFKSSRRNIEIKSIVDPLLRQTIKKLVILVPIINLANRVHAEFVEYFSIILLESILYALEELPNRMGRERGEFIENILKPLYKINANLHRYMSEFNSTINRRENALQFLQRNRNVNDNTKYKYQEAINIADNQLITLKSTIKNIISTNIKTFITQELVAMRAGQRDASGNKDYGNALVIISTYMAGKEIYKKHLKDKDIGMIVFDESHLLTTSDDNPSQTDGDSPENKCESAYYLIKNVKQDTKLVFLSGTINPDSARNFAKHIEKCYKKPIYVHSDNSGSNPSNISVITADWLKNDKNILNNLLINPSDSNNLVIILSRAKIIELINYVVNNYPPITTLQSIVAGTNDPFEYKQKQFGLNKYKETDEFRNYRRNYISPDQEMHNQINSIGNASAIVHPLQKQAVARGIGKINKKPI